MQKKKDFYADITNNIIEAMETYGENWIKPWKDMFPTRSNGELYTGINYLTLMNTMRKHAYKSPVFMTFNQVKAMGGHVNKGEKGHIVVYASMFEKENDKGDIDRIPFLKHYTVFNMDQTSGIDMDILESEKIDIDFVKAHDINLVHGGNSAFYSPSKDFIQMPLLETFVTKNAYTATLCHEAIHWTGHESRLNRDFSGRFGDAAYAFEELIAEIGSAMLCHSLGIENINQNAAYVNSWIKVLKNDKKAIFKAATESTKAHKFLLESV